MDGSAEGRDVGERAVLEADPAVAPAASTAYDERLVDLTADLLHTGLVLP